MMSGIHLREDWEKSTKSVRLAIVKERGEDERRDEGPGMKVESEVRLREEEDEEEKNRK